jgi:hypothetical protein
MFTPEMVSDIWKSTCVTCRAQPPFWMRRGALLKDAQNIGSEPTSVAGGETAPGNCPDDAGLFGPMIVVLDGLSSVLIAPCGGSSGLPKVAACAVAAAVISPPAAVATSTSRRERLSMLAPGNDAGVGNVSTPAEMRRFLQPR